jgi:hypothetical protein
MADAKPTGTAKINAIAVVESVSMISGSAP